MECSNDFNIKVDTDDNALKVIFKNIMNNYAWALIIWWKKNHLFYKVLGFMIVLIYFCFSFCSDFSDFNLEAAVVKTGKIKLETIA